MDTAQIDDLKDFLATLMGQTETRLENKIEFEVGTVRTELSDKIDTVHTELGGKIDAVHSELDHKIDFVRTSLSDMIVKLDYKIDVMHQEMLDGFEGVGDATVALHERIDAQDTRLLAAVI